MHGWRIDVDGVRSVLTSVVACGEALSRREHDLARFAEEAGGVFRPAARVATAVDLLLGGHADDVAGAASRVRSVIDAASLATQGYVAADEVMAVEAQASAASAFGGTDGLLH